MRDTTNQAHSRTETETAMEQNACDRVVGVNKSAIILKRKEI
jgi:hypothetical protein